MSHATEILQIYVPDVERPSRLMAEKILTQAFNTMHVNVSFVPLPGLRMQVMWREGKLDGNAVRALSTDLVNGVKVDFPVAYEEAVVYTINKKFTPNGYDSLRPYRVGYIAGTAYFEERLKNTPERESAPSIESLFKKLEVGRSDIVVESRFSACVLKKLGIQDVVILEPALERRPIYTYLHVRHKDLIPELESTLKAMEDDGSIKKLQDEAITEYRQKCPA
ncbi:transporter substrate-binding domain-containing protein [Undibacterium jejuense]|uniref:Transporter substrate-binding domain-containing protein n=1 Tax=Undibacterium jejuense TaxID=1344949 RepID=A0A923HDN6_9BURK|nr:transporter substrate-binding domain-containing protein [Undibacterium jejuense]MBC3862111.1 transporter substrate-binding domain-containing protein [Undibacterium jejuense]